MKRLLLMLTPFLLSPSTVGAFEATIERAGSVTAAPTASVSRNELAPLPGIAVAPERPPAAYAPEFRVRSSSTAPSSIPVPSSNPVAVSYCPSDVL
jgi:hypothetical protein